MAVTRATSSGVDLVGQQLQAVIYLPAPAKPTSPAAPRLPRAVGTAERVAMNWQPTERYTRLDPPGPSGHITVTETCRWRRTRGIRRPLLLSDQRCIISGTAPALSRSELAKTCACRRGRRAAPDTDVLFAFDVDHPITTKRPRGEEKPMAAAGDP